MAVTHTSSGFTGTVDQVAWSRLMAMASHRFRVDSATDWAVSVSGSTARTVNIAAGAGYACGVRDSTTAADTVAFTANGGGTNRYDALVASYVWGTPGVTFKAIAGTTSPPAVNTTTTVNAAQINRIPGTQYDAVLAIVQIRPSVGILSSGDLFDMRPYGGLAGPVILPNSSYLSLVDAKPGAEVYAVDTTQRWMTLDGSTWTWPPEAQGLLARSDYSSNAILANANTGLSAFTLTTTGIPSHRRLRFTFIAGINTDTAGLYTFHFYQGSYATGTLIHTAGVMVPIAGLEKFFSVPFWIDTTSASTSQTWTVGGERTTASGTFTLFGSDGPAQFSIEDVGSY